MTITDIRKELPRGAMREISKRTNLSVCTISDVLTGKRKSTKETLILNAIADYISELKTAEREAKEKLSAALGS